MAKPPLRTISLDAYTVEIDGQTFHPHQEEWVQVYPSLSVHETAQLTGLARDRSETPGWYGGATSVLAPMIAGWNVTDHKGEPLPPPSEGTIRQLDVGLIGWLFDQIAPAPADA